MEGFLYTACLPQPGALIFERAREECCGKGSTLWSLPFQPWHVAVRMEAEWGLTAFLKPSVKVCTLPRVGESLAMDRHGGAL